MERVTIAAAKDLAVGYNGTAVASGINFEVAEGDYLCVVGENGTGKSTLLKTLLGFVPPVSGELSLNVRPAGVGYLPQQADFQKGFPASVEEVILSGRLTGRFAPLYSREDKRAADEAASRFGVLDLKKEPFGTLSGGQRQRVLLARALCSDRQVLVLDEPATGLDPESTRSMYDTVAQLNASGLAIVMISHDAPAVERYASHTLRLCGSSSEFSTRKEEENV